LPTDDQSLAERIDTMEDLSLYLFELANMIHEHADMLFRLSDNAKAEADRLRRQAAAAPH